MRQGLEFNVDFCGSQTHTRVDVCPLHGWNEKREWEVKGGWVDGWWVGEWLVGK